MRTAVSAALLTMAMSLHVAAMSFSPKTNNEIVALDLKSGKLLWTHKPDKLSDAHFEVHEQGLVVYPHYGGNTKTNAVFLDPEKGTPVTPFKTESAPLAKSATFWPGPDIRLSNGWVLQGFSAGHTKTLTFVDKNRKKVWSIKTGGYPHQVRCWKDYVLYAFSYLSAEGVLYAYRAGQDKPSWTVDLNQIAGRDPSPA